MRSSLCHQSLTTLPACYVISNADGFGWGAPFCTYSMDISYIECCCKYHYKHLTANCQGVYASNITQNNLSSFRATIHTFHSTTCSRRCPFRCFGRFRSNNNKKERKPKQERASDICGVFSFHQHQYEEDENYGLEKYLRSCICTPCRYWKTYVGLRPT